MGTLKGAIQHWPGKVSSFFTGNRASAKAANIAWKRELEASNTSYQRRVVDLKAAGLNPMLAFSQGGASVPSAQPAEVRAPGGEIVRAYTGLMGASTQRMMANATTENLQQDTQLKLAQTASASAEARLKDAQTEEVAGTWESKRDLNRSLTDLNAAQIRQIDAKLPEIAATITKLNAETDTQRELAKKIRAEIGRIAVENGVDLAEIDLKKMTLDQKKKLFPLLERMTQYDSWMKYYGLNKASYESHWWTQNNGDVLDPRFLRTLGGPGPVSSAATVVGVMK